MAFNFVKFQRGSAQAYKRLKDNNALEKDALYFIYDKNTPENGGLLYLGDVLIGGTNLTNLTSLSDLLDVDFSNISLLDGMILQYKESSDTWIPVSIKTAVENSGAAIGSGSSKIDKITLDDSETIEDGLQRIDPNPSSGDIIFVDGKPYIYDGETWDSLVGTSMENRVGTLENKVSTLETEMNAVDGKIATAISQSNHLSYVVAQTLPTITEAEVGTLENKIFLVNNNSEDTNNQYDEYIFINQENNQRFEKIGNWNVNLNDYVTTENLNSSLQAVTSSLNSELNNYVLKTTYDSEVGDLSKILAATEKESTTVVDEILDIYDRLKWNEI